MRSIIIAAGFALLLIIPPALYWSFVGRAQELAPAEARALLMAPGSGWRLVDVQDEQDFRRRHVTGAENLPWKKISAADNPGGLPEKYRGGKLLLICGSGMLSAAAALRLSNMGLPDVLNVRGGITRWISLRCGAAEPFCSLAGPSGAEPFPFTAIPLYEQLAIVISAFVIKPLYMLLSFVLAIILLRRRDDDLMILGWSMASFFAGEAFCAVNYLLYGDDSVLLEFLHSSGMMMSFALFSLSLLEFIDGRIIRIENRGRACAFLPLCRDCWKHTGAPCTAVRLSLFLLPAAAVLSTIPLLAPFTVHAFNTDILGTWYTMTHPMPYQVYETVILPSFAIIFFSAAWQRIYVRGVHALPEAKALASIGAGCLGFSLFRLVLLAIYRDSLSWFGTWEEFTEFIFIAGLALALYLFRRGLFRGSGAAEGSNAA